MARAASTLAKSAKARASCTLPPAMRRRGLSHPTASGSSTNAFTMSSSLARAISPASIIEPMACGPLNDAPRGRVP